MHAERHDEKDDQDRDQPLHVGLGVDEPRVGRMDEEAGVAGEGRAVQTLEVGYVPESPTRWPPAAASSVPSSILDRGPPLPESLHFESGRIRLSTGVSQNSPQLRRGM